MIGSNKDFEGLRTNNKPETYYGLSTDEKPITAVNGSCFIEMDTSTMYFFDEEAKKWVPWSGSGGGGGGGDYQKVTIFDQQGIEFETDTEPTSVGDAKAVIPGHYPLSTLQPTEFIIIETSGEYEGTAKTMGYSYLVDDELIFEVFETPIDGFDWNTVIVSIQMVEEMLGFVLYPGEELFPASFTLNIKVSRIIPVE